MTHAGSDLETWIDPDGKFRWVSPSVLEATGYTPEEVMAMDDFIWTFIVAEDRELAATTLHNSLKGLNGESGSGLELRCLRKDSSMFWISVSWHQISDPQGLPLGVRIRGTDITDRKMMDGKRRVSDRALNAISQGVVIADINRLITWVNDAFCTITGYSRDEILGRDCKFLQGPETDPDTVEKIRSVRRSEVEFNGKLLNYRKDGSPFWNDLSIVPFRDDTSQVVGYVGVTRDITDIHNKEMEVQELTRRMTEAEKAKTDFLGMMSHELRTPLNGIIGFSDIILGDHRLPPDLRDKVRLIQSCGESLLHLLEDIFEYRRSQSELETRRQSVPFSISDIAWKSVRLVEADAKAKSLDLSVHIEEMVTGTVLGDPDKIQQVLLNLLRNAVKYTETGSVSLLISHPPGSSEIGRIRFAVKDTGVGIPEELHRHIFEPFAQAESTLSRKHSGIGIGLSTSKQLVEKLGSQLDVESQPGKGSVFSFEILLPAASSKQPTGRKDEMGLGALDKDFSKRYPLHILAVEDNVINLQVLIKLLKNLGYEDVYSAESGESALDLMGREKVDLIFMDLHMPGIDGIETTRRIRSLESSAPAVVPPVAIIALTGNVSPSVRSQCFDAGMNHYISKPFNTRSLAEGIVLCSRRKNP